MNIFDSTQHYLQTLFGLPIQMERWAADGALPYFLIDTYEFRLIRLLDIPCLLMRFRADYPGLVQVKKHIRTVRNLTDVTPVLLFEELASYERKTLIDGQVSFVVPGNQTYIPELAVDLREYFRKKEAKNNERVSPATQALLIRALLGAWQQKTHPSLLGAELGYTEMTLSRAAKEMIGFNIAQPITQGRERWVEFFAKSPQELWTQIRPVLSTPVKKRLYGDLDSSSRKTLAGETLLATRTMLTAASQKTVAINTETIKIAEGSGQKFSAMDQGQPLMIEVWSYSPWLLPNAEEADPFSLILSLQGHPDERVQMALAEFEENIEW